MTTTGRDTRIRARNTTQVRLHRRRDALDGGHLVISHMVLRLTIIVASSSWDLHIPTIICKNIHISSPFGICCRPSPPHFPLIRSIPTILSIYNQLIPTCALMQIYLLSSLFVRFAIAVLASGNINFDLYIYTVWRSSERRMYRDTEQYGIVSDVRYLLVQNISSVSLYLRIILEHIPLRRRHFIK